MLRQKRVAMGLDPNCFLDLLYADDVTTLIKANSQEDLCYMARLNDQILQEILPKWGLMIQKAKTQNMVWDPRIIPDGVFRRSDAAYIPNTRKRQTQQYQREAPFLTEPTDFDPSMPQATQTNTGSRNQQSPTFPYPLNATIKILGITFDRHFTFDEHFDLLQAKARTRQSIMAGVAHRKWGLETSILRISSDAIITSLLRYGLLVLGSSFPEDLIHKVDVQIINTTARRITGLHPSTRIETLHFLAGTHTYKNLYIRHSASFLHSSLTAYGSQIQARIRDELGAILEIPEPNTKWAPMHYDREATFLLGPEGLSAYIIDLLHWEQTVYIRAPNLKAVRQTQSIYHVHAPEITRVPDHRKKTFRFQDSYSWLDIALTVLFHIGWRPESSIPQKFNISRMLPPDPKYTKFAVDKPLSMSDRTVSIDDVEVTLRKIRVTTELIRVEQVYATLTLIQDGPLIRFCKGRVLGRGIMSITPDYAREVVVLHAMISLRSWLQTEDQRTLQNIDMRAGDPSLVYALQRWLDQGVCSLESAAASELLEIITHANEWLKVDLSLRPFYLPETFEEEERMDIPTKQILIMAEHFRTFVIPAQPDKWLQELPTIPCTKQEIKLLLEEQQHADERKALDQLQALGSESAGIIKELDLTRAVIAEVMDTLKDERNAQVVLFTILSATRFRTFVNKEMHPTVCPRPGCMQRDSFWHLVDCNKLRTSIERGADSALFLVHLARTMHLDSAPRPWYPEKSELTQARS